MEGPYSDESVARLLHSMSTNKIDMIFALGPHSDFNASHHNYYEFSQPKKFASEQVNLLVDTQIKKENSFTQTDYIQWYDLKLRISSPQQTDTSINVIHIEIKDGDTFQFSDIAELQKIYHLMQDNNVAFHCSAGKERTAILPMAFILAQEGVFEEEYASPEKFIARFHQVFFAVCEKRPLLSPNEKQLQQIFAFALAMTAFKNNIAPEDFPVEFHELPESNCRAKSISTFTFKRSTNLFSSTHQMPKVSSGQRKWIRNDRK
jgi:protein tyrosine phosphatase